MPLFPASFRAAIRNFRFGAKIIIAGLKGILLIFIVKKARGIYMKVSHREPARKCGLMQEEAPLYIKRRDGADFIETSAE
jgi:hypothetical protein